MCLHISILCLVISLDFISGNKNSKGSVFPSLPREVKLLVGFPTPITTMEGS
jgi:hypothetical protein